MPHVVTLDIFSGLPNPSWVLSDEQFKDLQKRADPKRALPATDGAIPVLGYRGFTVRPVEVPKIESDRLKGFAEATRGSGEVLLAGDPEVEDFLLATAGDAVSDELLREVRRSIADSVLQRVADVLSREFVATGCPPCNAADAPVYDPAFWNTPARQPNNNCYNYANNQATNTFAQPGRATGRPITALSCPGTEPSAISDGLRVTPGFAAPLTPGQGWYVALVIWPNRDYHWYRQDKNGCWSHKPGRTAAVNVDNAGKAITDPKTCDRGNYTAFCDYMITNRGVRIA